MKRPNALERVGDWLEQQAKQAQALKEKARQARRERIAAGKADWCDLVDEKDVVCAHCGYWTEGRPIYDSIDWETSIRRNDVIVRCPMCNQHTSVETKTTYTFTMEKIEGTDG